MQRGGVSSKDEYGPRLRKTFLAVVHPQRNFISSIMRMQTSEFWRETDNISVLGQCWPGLPTKPHGYVWHWKHAYRIPHIQCLRHTPAPRAVAFERLTVWRRLPYCRHCHAAPAPQCIIITVIIAADVSEFIFDRCTNLNSTARTQSPCA